MLKYNGAYVLGVVCTLQNHLQEKHLMAETNGSAVETEPNHTNGRIWFIFLQILSLLTVIPWIMVAISITALIYGVNIDVNPGEANTDLFSPGLLTAIWSYSIIPIATFIGALVLFRRGQTQGALWVSAVPLILSTVAFCLMWMSLFSVLP